MTYPQKITAVSGVACSRRLRRLLKPSLLGTVFTIAGALIAAPGAFADTTIASGTTVSSASLGGASISFQGGTLTIDSGATDISQNFTLINSSTSTIDANGNDAIFRGTFTGSGGMIFKNTGSGLHTITLAGQNTATGWTSIGSATVLALTGASSLAQSVGIMIGTGGALDISGVTGGTAVKPLGGTGSVILGSNTLSIIGGNTQIFFGAISGTGSVAVTGGIQSLSGNNTYSGLTSIAAGATLAMWHASTLASSSVNVQGVFDISPTDSGLEINSLSDTVGSGVVRLGARKLTLTAAEGTFAGRIQGTGSFVVAHGTETLTGSNSYTGTTSIGAGATLALSGSGSIAASAGVVNDGVFDISLATGATFITSLSGTGRVDLGSKALSLSAASGSYSGTIEGAGGFQVSNGTETLSGVNTYTGLTVVEAGATLALAGAGSIASSSWVIIEGVLDISGSANDVSVTSISDTASGSIVLGSKTLTVTSGSGGIYHGVISGSGGFAVTGGTQGLSGVNTYTGTTTIGAGATLSLSGSGSIEASAGVVNDGLLDLTPMNDSVHIKSLSGSGRVQLSSDQVLWLSAASGTYSGTIDGAGPVYVFGGRETFAGVNTYVKPTLIYSGATLALAGAGSIASSERVIADGVLDISGSDNGVTIKKLFSTATTSSIVLGSKTLTVAAATGETFDGVISGSGGFAVANGTQILSGTNTYTGTTTIGTGATLVLSGSGSIASSAGVVNGGLLDVSGVTVPANIQSLSGSGRVVLGGNALHLTAASGTYSGTIEGTGPVDVLGGRETLTGVNTYTGTTTIGTGATLALSGAGSIASSSVVVVDGVLDISGSAKGVSVQRLTQTNAATTGRAIVLGSQTLSLTAGGGSFAGVISGTGGLVIGSGLQLLTGANTYTGTTTVKPYAILQIGGGGTTGSIAGDVVADGALTFARSDTVTMGGVLSGSGFLIKDGSGTLILSNNNTFTGYIYVFTGTLQIGAGGNSGAIASSSISNAGAVVFNRSDAVNYNGTITGTGTLTKMGAGTLTLNGVNTYSGLTSVAGGTLLIGDAAHSMALVAGDVAVAGGATLGGHGAVGGKVVNNGTVMPGGSIGTLSVKSYSQSSTATLQIEVGPQQASQLFVAGAASLDGTLSLVFDAGSYRTAIYPLVKSQSITGAFANMTVSGSPSDLFYSLYYKPDKTEVDLVVLPKSEGQIYGDVVTANLGTAHAMSDIVLDHAALSAGSAREPGAKGWSVWSEGFGAAGQTGAGNGADGFSNMTWGVVEGVDYRFDDTHALHGAFAYSFGKVATGGSGAHASNNSLFFSLAGHYANAHITLDADGFYATDTATISRKGAFGGTDSSNFASTASGLSFQVGYPLVGGDVVPLAKFTYARLTYGPFRETSADGLGLSGGHGAQDSARYEIGARVSHTFTTDSGISLKPSFFTALAGDALASAPSVAMQLASVGSAGVAAASPSPDSLAAVVRFNLDANLSDVLSVQGGINGRFGAKQQEGLFHLRATYRF